MTDEEFKRIAKDFEPRLRDYIRTVKNMKKLSPFEVVKFFCESAYLHVSDPEEQRTLEKILKHL